jgi:2-alkyl-3-oxoalkanoate reductase
VPTILITGATGFVGSHIADLARQKGYTVRALARPTADLSHLKSLNAEIIPGDLNEPASIAKAVDSVEFIIHAAAKVGDWGHVADYRKVNVEGQRNLLDAVKGKPIRRFVHISSLGVYEARHHNGTDEAEPLPENHIDGYTQSKVECEKLAFQYAREQNLPITILRPGFVYGPRDRSVLPRLVDRLKERSIIYIARGRYALNTTYVGNIAEACFLALDNEKAMGEVFNITDGEYVTKKQFFEMIADGVELPRPKISIPLWLARRLAAWRERVFRKKNKPHPPRITQASLKFAGLNLDFSIAKARLILGYDPKVGFREGMAKALEWYKTHDESVS